MTLESWGCFCGDGSAPEDLGPRAAEADTPGQSVLWAGAGHQAEAR